MRARAALLLFLLLVAAVAFAAAGCTTPGPPPFDYTEYREHMPCSILILPPLHDTPEPGASHAWLSMATCAVAERGYYVFPVAVTEQFLHDNGLPGPGEMHEVPAEKYGEILGADAVLYPTLKEWGNQYLVLSSVAEVAVTARLVDTRTGTVIWEGEASAMESSAQGNDNLIGMLAAALITQVFTSSEDRSRAVAGGADHSLFCNGSRGLLPGPRLERHGE